MSALFKIAAARLLTPLMIALGAITLGLVLALVLIKPHAGVALASLGLALLVLASWAPLADRALTVFESRYPALEALPADGSLAGVVVLGGGWQPGAPRSSVGRLNDSSAIRLMEGIRLWRQAEGLPLVVVGASRGPKSAATAWGYARAARELGVAEESLLVLDWPTDTGLEAQAVSDSLGEGARVVLVTSASHMPRAMRYFRRAGLDPIAAPTHYLIQGRSGLNYWVPAVCHLRKTERAAYEAMGQLAMGRKY